MTSATAPSGCTTMSGALAMLNSCSTTANPSMSVPSTQYPLDTSASTCGC